MKKEHFLTATYLLTSVGLFVLAIEMWICGAEPHCRQSNALVAKIAKAAVSVSVPDYYGSGWSGPDNPNFNINFQQPDVVTVVPSDGDGDGDGH